MDGFTNSNDLSPSENEVDSAVASAVRFGFVKKGKGMNLKKNKKRKECM